MATPEIVIIGAGVIGCSLAASLAKRGLKPLILERERICSGTTGQSGGVVRQLYSNPQTALLAKRSLDVFRSWSDHYLGDSGFQNVGVLFTLGEDSTPGIAGHVAKLAALGIDMRMLKPDEAADLDPRFSYSDCTAVSFEPTAGGADPVLTTHAFAQTARSLGAEIREGVTATDIVITGGRVAGVETSAGSIRADVVVDAAGAWGLDFVGALGFAAPITFSRHPMALIRRIGSAAVAHPIVLDIHTDSYYIPRGDLTLVGKLGTMPADDHVDPETYERGVSNSEIARYRKAASLRMPGLAGGVVWGGWSGIYDDSIDAHPIIDAVPGADGLYCALGMSGNCFKLSPVIGELLADRIVGGASASPELDLFRLGRFADGTAHVRAFGSLSVLA